MVGRDGLGGVYTVYFATSKLIFCDYRAFRKPSKRHVSTPTSPLLHDNHPSRRNVSFRRPHPRSLTTTATTPAEHTVANPAYLE